MKEVDRAAVEEALRLIIKNREVRALNYCVEYARYGLYMLTAGQASDSDIRVQLIYVLGNMTHWRGEEAKYVRQVLKAVTGSK